MAIQDTDLFLVNRSNSSFKCSKANIDNVRDSDLFLINRDNASYYCSKANISNVRDSDTILVNRSNFSYRATGADLKELFVASSPGTSGQDSNWCGTIVSTNDPGGIQNCAELFKPRPVQDLSKGGKVNGGYWIQIDLPFPQHWTYGSASRFSCDLCMATNLKIWASTDVTGRDNWELVQTINNGGYGNVGVVALQKPINGAKEIYAVRYEAASPSQPLMINNFGTSEHGNWRVGASGGNSYSNPVMQFKDTDKYIYLPVSGMDATTLNTGDTLTVSGTSATGKVYKVIDSSTVLMSLDSTDPWPAGPITVS